jgi:hypothetical protein
VSVPSGIRMVPTQAEARAAHSRGVPAPVRRRMMRLRLVPVTCGFAIEFWVLPHFPCCRSGTCSLNRLIILRKTRFWRLWRRHNVITKRVCHFLKRLTTCPFRWGCESTETDIGGKSGVARSGGKRMQPRKGAVPCLRFWFVRQPSQQSDEVHRCRCHEVGKVCLRASEIGRPPKPSRAHPLRDRALDPGPPRILDGKLGGPLPRPPDAQRLVLSFGADCDGPAC